MEFTFTMRYDYKAMAAMARAMRVGLQTEQDKKSKLIGWLFVVATLVILITSGKTGWAQIVGYVAVFLFMGYILFSDHINGALALFKIPEKMRNGQWLFREDGYFSYETTDHEKSVYLGKNDTKEDVIKFANSLYQNIIETESMLVLKDIEEKKDGETVYNLIYSDGNAHLYLDGIYGASVSVKDGYISKYSQYPLILKEGTDAFFTGSVIEAYDKIYKTDLWQDKKDLTIEKILPVNFYNGNETVLRWYIEFSDGSKEFL